MQSRTPAKPILTFCPESQIFTISVKRPALVLAMTATCPLVSPRTPPAVSIGKQLSDQCGCVLGISNLLIKQDQPGLSSPTIVCRLTLFKASRMQEATYAISGPNLKDYSESKKKQFTILKTMYTVRNVAILVSRE